MSDDPLISTFDFLIEDALARMDGEAREHFKVVCGALLACYTNDKLHGLVLVGRDDGDSLDLAQIVSINSTDINAVQLVAAAQNQVSLLVNADAPPKELFN